MLQAGDCQTLEEIADAENIKIGQAIVSMNVGAPDGAIPVVYRASLKLNWRREVRLVDPDAVVEVIGPRRRALPDG